MDKLAVEGTSSEDFFEVFARILSVRFHRKTRDDEFEKIPDLDIEYYADAD
ncbi:hypothetical protein [Natronorubrum sp. A-ect3]|uniref:hypothetical protein n=1 Tax=Natronorubrum sp. A-ect3 TaxID=3242698 RepID=UPI00359CEA33